MIRILQLSDIHFKKLPDARDEYAQMRGRMYETLEDICKKSTIDCALICGDVAFSGDKEEYEQKAKVFINNVIKRTSLKSEQIYMVPGSHDKNREAVYQSTRGLLRDGMLNNTLGAKHFFDLYKDENDVFKKWLIPFEAYIAFANEYRCVSMGVLNTITDTAKTFNDKFFWYDDLSLGKYILRLHGINSCYGSDKEDQKHLQFLPRELYHTTKNRNVINVSIMHHPLEFVNDREIVEKEIDNLYPIQFYGHIHRQSVESHGTLKIFSGAFMPPKNKGEGGGEDGYEPVFNIIEFKEGTGVIYVTVKPYKWQWTSEEDGLFENQKEEGPFEIAVDNANALVEVQRKTLKLPKGIKKRNIEIEFLQSDRSDEIMMKMYNDFKISNDAVADASVFFERVEIDNRYEDLYNYIHEK